MNERLKPPPKEYLGEDYKHAEGITPEFEETVRRGLNTTNEEAVQQAQIHMMGLRGTIDQETFDRLGFIIHGTVEMAQKVDVHDEAKNPYKVGFGAGSNAYKIAEGSPAYGAGGSAYKTDLSYLGKKSIYKK
ncbi:MAG: hypothetical protein UY81_C0051G0009 [Candidatus Giovannonibacteria bacterium GW2011_GWA2_53_7]|uniref:Uncharacterized protein n=1 Tax=Candidatus Giovannonibacteria bacterium GW2011_GWA2_53_7 TaxID=1618650 RepID=A0A0G1XVG1_9BACT|nr:MAG: hypothetical protein UY81_C0051G0009 [Candidatus Giovannonibacteria bacterium GW2011_GWA2_53_7]